MKTEEYTGDTPAPDATTIKKIWPKLNPEQQAWVTDLSADERETLVEHLNHYGESYLLQCWQSYVNSLDYVRNL